MMSGGANHTNGLMENFVGVAEMMFGREEGLKRVDRSDEAFWWSFAALLLAAMIDATLLSSLYGSLFGGDEATAPAKGYYIVAKLGIALIAYASSMTALYLLCRQPRQQARFPLALTAHNWAAPLVSLFATPFLLVSALSGADGSLLLRTMPLLLLGCLVIAGYRLIRISLDISAGQAVLFFMVTAAVSLIFGEGLESFLALTPSVAQ